jgi:hypothetical protein
VFGLTEVILRVAAGADVVVPFEADGEPEHPVTRGRRERGVKASRATVEGFMMAGQV